MDTAYSSKTISATHSLLPSSVNSAFLRRSMCVVFFCFVFLLLFTGVTGRGGGWDVGKLASCLIGEGGRRGLRTMFQVVSGSFLQPDIRKKLS